MTTYGVTSTGFLAPNLQDLLAQIEADQLATISATLDVSSDSPFGQVNGIFAHYLAEAWEALAGAYDGFDPDKAEDVMLTMLCKLTGTQRAAATQSAVLCTVTADVGTVIVAGTHFASVTGRPDVKFTPKTTFTAGLAVTPGVLFVSEHTGAIQAPAGSLIVIATPVVGWTSITNPVLATLGADIESDADLRLTRQLELTAGGSATVDSIRAKLTLLFAAQPSASVTIFNNTSDYTDANSLPPHSFEAVIYASALIYSNDQIAQVIWDNKPAGIRSYGSTTGNAVDSSGANQAVSFTRATEVPIYITAALVHRPGFSDNATFANAWVTGLTQGIVVKDLQGNIDTILTPYATGVAVTSYDLTVATQGLGAKVTSLTFGTAAYPVGSIDVPINIRQIATFATANITLTP